MITLFWKKYEIRAHFPSMVVQQGTFIGCEYIFTFKESSYTESVLSGQNKVNKWILIEGRDLGLGYLSTGGDQLNFQYRWVRKAL
jgi:hypothetical protein